MAVGTGVMALKLYCLVAIVRGNTDAGCSKVREPDE